MKKTFLPISSYRITRLAVVGCLSLLGAYGKTATAQTLTTLYTFSGSDGANPAWLVQGSDGNFYGTTSGGGANTNSSGGCGEVFRISPSGSLTILYSFCSQPGDSDGVAPWAGLVQGSDGNFYSTTFGGGASTNCPVSQGASGCGTVFRLSPSGTLTTLYSFCGSDGTFPTALVQGSDGNFYSTTFAGGASTNCTGLGVGCGTVFRLSPSGALTTLYSFCGPDGDFPAAGVVQGSDGNFYGTTYNGGASTNRTFSGFGVGCGTVFRVTPSGILTVLYSFSGSDGENPDAGLVQGSDGNFYGTTFAGGVSTNCNGGCGTVFRITPSGTLTTLYSFSGSDGAYPEAALMQGRDGNFYGTTAYGGAYTNCYDGCGTVFQITPSGTLTTLYSFSGSEATFPNALVQGSDGNFYGTTTYGGTSSNCYGGCGMVIRFSAPYQIDAWISSTGDKWEIGSNNWSLGVAPSINDTVDQIANAGTKTVTIDATTVLSNSVSVCLTISNLVISAPPGSVNTLLLNNAGAGTPLQVLTSLTVSNGGVLQVTGSSLTAGTVTNMGLVAFSSGQLTSGGTSVSNSQTFAVGDGTDAAMFQLNGGIHSFANGLEIRSNATLAGCGTISGNLVVDPGGTVLANCGSALGFTGAVTNNGSISAVSGTTLNFFGALVNDSVIVATNGSFQFYSTVVNNGAIASPTNDWIDGTGKWETPGNWLLSHAPSLAESADVIANGGNNTVTIDAVTSSNSPATLTVSNVTVSANTLSLNNAGTNVALHVLSLLKLTNGGTMLVTNSALQVDGSSLGNAYDLRIDSTSSLKVQAGSLVQINGAGAELGSLAGDPGSLLIEGGSLSVPQLAVGGNGTGTVLVIGGSLFVTNATSTGQLTLYNGTFTLSNEATVVADTFTNVSATFTNLGGTFVVNSQATLNQGTATFSGGTNQFGSTFTVASTAGSTGAVAVTGGSLVATNGATTVGDSSNSVASVTVSSNATFLTSVTSLAAATNSTASLTLQGTATMQVLSNLTAGSGVGSTATVSIAGGQLTATNGVIGIGNNGSTTNGFGYAQMTVSNSSVVANQILLGSSAGGHGDLTIQPSGVVSIVGSNALLVPDGVTISGGELDIDNGEIQCGGGASFPGSLTMSSGTANCMVIDVGDTSAGTLTISGGQMSVSPLMDVGYASGSAGAVWMSGGTLTASVIILGDSGVGQLSLSNNGIIQVSSSFSVGASGAQGSAGTLTVAGGALTVNAPLNVGVGSVWVSGGQLQATSLLLGYNNCGVGQLTISNGSVQANSLILTNGANSQFSMVGGTLESGGTVATNNQGFVVGNGSSAATFSMAGGTHWFGNGLEIANNATLSGCGTINGTVTIDAGAHAMATCGTVTFSNTVTINGNGVVRALNGSVLNFTGPVVNNGAIDVLNGSATFSSPPTGTGYILTTNCLPVITAIQRVGADVHVSFTTGTNAPYSVNYKTDMVPGPWTTLMSVTGTGGTNSVTDSGATLQPKRFYQINLVVPP